MHFLVVATAWGSRHGGINSFNVSLCEALRIAGQTVTCFVVDAHPPDVQAAAESGVTLIGAENGPGLNEFPQQRLLVAPLELSESIDYVIGHWRITGPQAFQLHRMRFPQAGYIHFVHMHADTIDGEKQPPTRHELTEARMRAEHELLEKSALAVAVGPRLTALYTPEFAARCPGRAIHGFVPGKAIAVEMKAAGLVLMLSTEEALLDTMYEHGAREASDFLEAAALLHAS